MREGSGADVTRARAHLLTEGAATVVAVTGCGCAGAIQAGQHTYLAVWPRLLTRRCVSAPCRHVIEYSIVVGQGLKEGYIGPMCVSAPCRHVIEYSIVVGQGLKEGYIGSMFVSAPRRHVIEYSIVVGQGLNGDI